MKEWLNINELAEQTNIPDTTVRRYVSKFSTYFVHKGGARSRRYEDSGVKVLMRIKQLYDNGYETEEADSVLRKEFSVVMDGDNEQESFEKANTPALATVEDIKEIKEALNQQKEFNKLLLEKLSGQEIYIRESLENRDNLLMQSLKESQETRKQIATAEEEKKKGGKLF